MSSQVSAARAQKADAEARARLIRDALRSGQSLDSSDVTNSELIRRLSEQRVTLRAQLAEQSSTLLPQHPRIKEMRAQIADLDQQIRAEGERLVRSLESEAKVAGARLETLSANLDQLKRQTASTSDQDVQLRALEREAKAQRDLFESYLAKYREATARDSIAAAPADARIISRAVVSNVPYFPKKMPIVLIAALGTFCLSTAFVVTGALLSGETYRPAPRRTDADRGRRRRAAARPANARTPRQRPAAAPRPICRLPAPQRRRRLPRPRRRLRARRSTTSSRRLQQSGEGGRRIAVIGSARDVGTTLTAIALARALARTARVVLVDLAFASPNVDVISNDPAAPGMADLVRGAGLVRRHHHPRPLLAGASGRRRAGRQRRRTDCCNRRCCGPPSARWRKATTISCSMPARSPRSRSARSRRRRPMRCWSAARRRPMRLRRSPVSCSRPGFAEVTVLTGPPPALEQAAAQSAA